MSFDTELKKILADYGDIAKEAIDEATEKYTKEALKEIKQKSPKDSGEYAKGWRSTVNKSRTHAEGCVYNATDYQLTHLLEFGHAKVNGGRTKAIPHISKVNDSIIEKYEKEIMNKL